MGTEGLSEIVAIIATGLAAFIGYLLRQRVETANFKKVVPAKLRQAVASDPNASRETLLGKALEQVIDLREKAQTAEADQEAARTLVAALDQEVKGLRSELNLVKAQLTVAEREVARLTIELERSALLEKRVEGERDDLRRRLEAANARVNELERRVKELEIENAAEKMFRESFAMPVLDILKSVKPRPDGPAGAGGE